MMRSAFDLESERLCSNAGFAAYRAYGLGHSITMWGWHYGEVREALALGANFKSVQTNNLTNQDE